MLNELVQNNYNEILTAAINITRRRNRHQAKALINETYLKLFEKNEYPKENQDFVKVYVKTMHYLYMGERSTYNKAETSKHITLEYDPGSEDWRDIEVNAEGVNEETKDTMLAASNLTTDKAVRYIKVLECKDQLAPHERELFTLHFELGMGSRKIAKQLSTSFGWKTGHTNINKMINKIKEKLNGHT
jgi:RNA polymerase sigma factor (sigma-70 family)